MDCRYKIHKEFFGGIIYDTKTKKNVSIDHEIYSFIKSLVSNTPISNTLNSNEIMELLHQLFDIGIFNTDVDFIESEKQEYSDHLCAPFRIFYDITYECNLRCKHCFTNSGNKACKELSLAEKLTLISEIKKLGTQRISIAGGEPFICPDLFDVLDACRENNIDVSITTNGTLFTPAIISRLNKYSLKNLTVSFDGGTISSMDSIRGKGTYDLVVSGLKLLREQYNNSYSIKTTLMKNNIHEIEDIIKIAIENNCQTVKFNCVREDGRATTNSNIVLLNSEEYVSVIEHIERIKNKYKSQIQIKAPLNVFCEEEYDYIEDLGFGCFAGKESLCINPIGDIKPCSHFPSEFICGNIRDKSLLDIWHNSDILYHFRHLSGNDQCNNCDQYDMCRAGCRYRAFKAGDLNGIDPFCYVKVLNNGK